MKKLQILTLSMLFSTGMMVQADAQRSLKTTLQGKMSDNQAAQLAKLKNIAASNLTNDQLAKISAFKGMSPAEQKAALKNSTQVQTFQAMTPADKQKAILAKYQSRVAAGTNIFTGNTVNRAITAMSTATPPTGNGSTSGSDQSNGLGSSDNGLNPVAVASGSATYNGGTVAGTGNGYDTSGQYNGGFGSPAPLASSTGFGSTGTGSAYDTSSSNSGM